MAIAGGGFTFVPRTAIRGIEVVAVTLQVTFGQTQMRLQLDFVKLGKCSQICQSQGGKILRRVSEAC